MTVEELVAQLEQFPGYYPVKVEVTAYHFDDLTGEESDRTHADRPTEVTMRQDAYDTTTVVVIR